MKNIIKSLRKEKNLTQFELAEKLDLDQTTVSKWELGKAIPDTQTLLKLSDFFDVSIDYLLGRSIFYYPDRINTDLNTLSSEERQLVEDYRALSPALKEMIQLTIQTWKGAPANANKPRRA